MNQRPQELHLDNRSRRRLGAAYGAVSGRAAVGRTSVCVGGRERFEQFAHRAPDPSSAANAPA